MDFKVFQRDEHHWDIYSIEMKDGVNMGGRKFKIRGEPGSIFLMGEGLSESINFKTVGAAMSFVCDYLMGG